LVPEAERGDIAAGKFKRLIVVPDGPLALLPFETLIVTPGEPPQTLLDVGPPLLYGPSATVLKNLWERRRVAVPRDRPAVCTVGDPSYPPRLPAVRDEPVQLAARSSYSALGGALAPLPYSGWESDWVAAVFQRSGVGSVQLRGAEASEANLRRQIAGRSIIHLACHGLADQAYGNFFGALALSPGRAANDSEDDGFLTLPEIYQLDLKACDLAILSACQTNFGPEQRGEGVWALSRGFLVAGARRVVASNWLVDDEAAASLVSYFCGGLAQAEKAGQPPDYAAALHAAKRWVRQQPKWQSPFYWAPFVMIGPN
jgi:CHAT domain-containing protein